MLVTVRDTSKSGEVAVINLKKPESPVIETRCPTDCVPSGLALSPSQHFPIGCSRGRPLIVLNALSGKVMATIDQIHGMSFGTTLVTSVFTQPAASARIPYSASLMPKISPR
jgi:hypothetical protein